MELHTKARLERILDDLAATLPAGSVLSLRATDTNLTGYVSTEGNGRESIDLPRGDPFYDPTTASPDYGDDNNERADSGLHDADWSHAWGADGYGNAVSIDTPGKMGASMLGGPRLTRGR